MSFDEILNNINKKAGNLFKTYRKKTDTITTKILTVFIFITIIPLMVIAIFSTSIINGSMFKSAGKELDISIKLAKGKHSEQFDNLKILAAQSSPIILKSYEHFLLTKDKKDLVKNLTFLKESSDLTFCFIVDKNNKIINSESSTKIVQIKGDLSKLINSAFSGHTLVSNEIINQSDIKFDKQLKTKRNSKYYTLSTVIAKPIQDKDKKVQSILFLSKSLKNNDIPSLLKNVTGATINFYQIKNKKINLLATNTYKKNNKKTLLNSSIVDHFLNNGEDVLLKTQMFDKREIGKFMPIKNINGNVIGIIYAGLDEGIFINPGNKNISLIAIIMVVSLFIVVIMAAILSRAITRPLLKLLIAANEISMGNLNQKINIKGDDEISMLAASFTKMSSDLYQQQQIKDNFIAMLTHDLKVPMLAENKTVSYMLEGAYGELTSEQREVLEIIRTTNHSSLEMVNTLLEAHRYDSGNKTILFNSTFDLAELSQQAIKEVKSLADEKSITFALSKKGSSLNVNADKREIKRVLHNLLSNAISNGIKRGSIVIEIQEIKESKKWFKPIESLNIYTTLSKSVNIGKSILFSIKDDGVGIRREDIQGLFKKFSFNKGRNPMGTGIGLYYCSLVVRQHGGHIWAESCENKGTTFYFTLPINSTKKEG